jgi:hypothetical protein
MRKNNSIPCSPGLTFQQEKDSPDSKTTPQSFQSRDETQTHCLAGEAGVTHGVKLNSCLRESKMEI